MSDLHEEEATASSTHVGQLQFPASKKGAGPEESTEALKKLIAAEKKTQFAHLLLFNSLHTTGSPKDGIERMSSIHANLMLLHGLMAGFQFVALENGSLSDDQTDWGTLDKTTFTVRTVGFGMNLLGWCISLIAMEFYTSVLAEDPEFQVRGILKYQPFFLLSDKLGVAAGCTLALTANLIIHAHQLPIVVPIIINVVSGLALILYLAKFAQIILKRQDYGDDSPGRHLYKYHDN